MWLVVAVLLLLLSLSLLPLPLLLSLSLLPLLPLLLLLLLLLLCAFHHWARVTRCTTPLCDTWQPEAAAGASKDGPAAESEQAQWEAYQAVNRAFAQVRPPPQHQPQWSPQLRRTAAAAATTTTTTTTGGRIGHRRQRHGMGARLPPDAPPVHAASRDAARAHRVVPPHAMART